MCSVIGWTAGVMSICSVLHWKTQREGKHTHTQHNLDKISQKGKKEYWRNMAQAWLFSCILLNAICLLGSSTNKAVAFRLCKYDCYTCEINSLKYRKRQNTRNNRLLVYALLILDYCTRGLLFVLLLVLVFFCVFFFSGFLENSSIQTEKRQPYYDAGPFITFKKLMVFLRLHNLAVGLRHKIQ